MVARLDELQERNASFAVETTLANRSLAHRIAALRRSGYQTRLVYLYLPSVQMAIERVADRVARGGHAIAEGVIRRRYHASLRNLLSVYLDAVESWILLDNSHVDQSLVASRKADGESVVYSPLTWATILEKYGAGTHT
jgi:predicted ABC-type ATPase